MYINLLDYVGTIFNKEDCIKELRANVKSLKGVPDNKVGFKVNQLSNNGIFRYFTQDYIEVDESSDKKFWMWVDSGFKDKSNDVLYFQFRYSVSGWTGAFVGTEKSIIEHQEKEDNKKYKVVSLDVENFKNSVSEESDDFFQGMLNAELEELKSKLQNTSNEDYKNDNNTKEKQQNSSDEAKSPSDEQVNDDYSSKNTQDKQNSYVDKSQLVRSTTSAKQQSSDDTKFNSVYENIFNRLLIQSGWDTKSLSSYISIIISRINLLLSKKEDCSKYLLYNRDNSVVLINTALLDKFGNSMLLICNIKDDGSLSSSGLRLVDGKQMLLRLNFEKGSINGMDIERVRFYNDNVSELIFNGDIDEFDFNSYDRLTHCIDERRDRFPDEYQNTSSEAICSDMIKAIELGVKLSKYDSNYIKPIYNTKSGQIHFVVPFHLGNNFRKKHELGIVIANFNDTFWQVMTILDYKSCQDDIRVLALYSDEF